VDLFTLEAESAKTFLLSTTGGSIFLLLIVLKFAKSLVTKLILSILFVGIGTLAFTQRDNLSGCIEKVSVQIQAGQAMDSKCSFLGQDVQISLP
jgi:hypothetical protein